MSFPVSVICPSRDRPHQLLPTVQSVLDTSGYARVYVYLDADQEELYAGPRMVLDRQRVKFLVGPRVGPIGAANQLARVCEGEVIGMIPDDCIFHTPRWDDWVLSLSEELPGGIGVLSAAHNSGAFLNFPWVTREWLDTIGWFYYPRCYHSCADTIVELLGEATMLIEAVPEQFYIEHVGLMQHTESSWPRDVVTFADWCRRERRPLVARLREQMAA